MTKIKICGITSAETAEFAIKAGADFIGLVFFKASPRNISLTQAADIVSVINGRAASVVVLVNPDDFLLAEIFASIKPDYVQLHGAESAFRCAEIKAKYGTKIIKAIKIKEASDIRAADEYSEVADFILLDADTKDESMPGGKGVRFNWQYLDSVKPKLQFFLAGGINAHNVKDAISAASPFAVDVSSGVELTPGIKCHDKIAEFVKIVSAALPAS